MSRPSPQPDPHRSGEAARRAPSHQSSSSVQSVQSVRKSEKTHMESAVTKLLVSTRELLSSLTDWSVGKISETEVSDYYVKLGNDFNVAVSAFTALEIPMQDLLSVPAVLRDCLERCINEEPTPQNLERALPEIRTTIVNLLQGLKTKQAVYKARREDDRRRPPPANPYPRSPAGHSFAPGDRPTDSRRSGETRRSGEDKRRATPEPSYGPSPPRHASPLPPTPDVASRWQPPRRANSGHGPHASTASSSSRPLPPQPQASSSSSRLPPVQVAPQPHAYPERTTSTSSSIYSSYAPSVVHPHDTPPERPPSSADPHSMPKRSYMSSRSRPQASRPGEPLPAPPPDAFRPPRRSGGGSGDSADRSRSPNPTDERAASLDSNRGSQTSSQTMPSPAIGPGSLDIRQTRSPSHEPTGHGKSPAPPMTVVTSSAPADNGPVSPRPRMRHSLSDPVSPPHTSSSSSGPPAAATAPLPSPKPTPLPPIVTAASPPGSPHQLPPIPVSSPLLPASPPMHTLPLPSAVEPLQPGPPLPPMPNSIADQTLSNLRGSGNAISRRASQRYSLYQIEKISDSVPTKREKSSRRVSGMMGVMKDASASLSGSSSLGDFSAMTKRASPARPSRAERPPIPTGGSPLRGGGFVPPAEDAGVEVAVEQPDATSPGSSGSNGLPTVPARSVVRSRSGLITPKGSLEPELAPLGEEDESSSTPGRSLAPSPSFVSVDDGAGPVDAEPPTPEQITAFLLHGRECKKVQIASQPSIPVLRMLFMERFGYATEGGEEWPAIYCQDPKTEWRYEWDETEGLSDGVRLSLNIEPLDQVKAHIDVQMAGLSRKLEDLIRDSVAPLSSQFATLQARQVSAVQTHRLSQVVTGAAANAFRSPSPGLSPQAIRTADSGGKRLAPGSSETGVFESPRSPSVDGGTPLPPVSPPVEPASPEPVMPAAPGAATVSVRVATELKNQFDELQTLRRDLGVARQIHVDGMKAMKDIFSTLRKENQRVREIASTSLGGGRAFVEAGKVKIDSQSQDVLRKVEDLQDVIEELYTDVTEKLVVPRPTLMRSLKKDITEAERQLQDLVGATKTAASTWRTTWAQEMENVMAEEKQLKYHLAFTNDIEEDFTNLQKVFGQIEMYAAQRTAAGGMATVGRGRGYRPPSPTEKDPAQSLSSVLFEIQGSRVDPDKRLKAIENAARMRQRELDEKRGADDVLQTQLSDFVEGRKLKKTGGVEETERLRQKKNELALRGGVPLPSPGPGSLSPHKLMSPVVTSVASGMQEPEIAETATPAPDTTGGASPVAVDAEPTGEPEGETTAGP